MRLLDPTADASILFAAGEARHDKLTVSLKVPIAVSSVETFREITEIWADRSDIQLFTLSDSYGNPEYSKDIKLSKGWLISGSGSAYIKRGTLTGSISLKLSVNPTLYLAHQLSTDLDTIENTDPMIALRRPIVPLHLGSLDGNDNILDVARMGGRTFERRQSYWDRVNAIYFSHLKALLTRYLAPFPRGSVPSGLLTQFTDIQINTISQAEVHWELSTTDAPTLMAKIRSAVGMVSPAFQWTYPGRFADGVAQNSAWVTLPLTADCNLRIYAKELTRIRFEISYTSHLPVTGFSHRPSPPGQSEMCRKLSSISHDASQRMARCWTAVAAIINQPDETGKISDFLRLIRRAKLGSYEDLFVALLQTDARIVETGRYRAALRRLVREGILLEPLPAINRGGNVYPLARPWEHMFQANSMSGLA